MKKTLSCIGRIVLSWIVLIVAYNVLSSFSTTEEDYIRIYNHAKSGDIDAMYRIVCVTEEIDTILPMDTIDGFRDTLLKRGYPEFIYHLINLNKKILWNNALGEKPRIRHYKHEKATQTELLDIGISAGQPDCLYRRYWLARSDFKKTKTEKDSLEYIKYLNLCRENNVYYAEIYEARCTGQPLKWIKTKGRLLFPILSQNIREMGLIQGTFHTAFCDISSFPIEFFIKYIFTRHWWKSLLFSFGIVIVCIIAFFTPFFVVKNDVVVGKPMFYGAMLGLAHCILYFFSINQHNYLWGKTVFSLWYPSYSFGVSPYLPIGINWLIIFAIFYHLWQNRKRVNLGIFLLSVGFFFYAYLLSAVMSFLIIFLWFFCGSMIGATKGAVEGAVEVVTPSKKSPESEYEGGWINVNGLGVMYKLKSGDYADSLGNIYSRNQEGEYVPTGGQSKEKML